MNIEHLAPFLICSPNNANIADVFLGCLLFPAVMKPPLASSLLLSGSRAAARPVSRRLFEDGKRKLTSLRPNTKVYLPVSVCELSFFPPLFAQALLVPPSHLRLPPISLPHVCFLSPFSDLSNFRRSFFNYACCRSAFSITVVQERVRACLCRSHTRHCFLSLVS